MVGVEHFYLFNNLSEDDPLPTLLPYVQKGIVELYEWPYDMQNLDHWNWEIQLRAYKKILREKRQETRWLAFIDLDEFIVPKEDQMLPELLQEYEDFAALCINWQVFGISNVKKIAPDKTVIETLTKRAHSEEKENLHVKSIVQPKKVRSIPNSHYCKAKWGSKCVTENKVPMKGAFSPSVSTNKIQINHYVYRDEEFFFSEKLRRYELFCPEAPPMPPPDERFVAVEDKDMMRFVPKLQKRLFET